MLEIHHSGWEPSMYTFSTGLCSYAYELMSFRSGMTVGTTDAYILVPVFHDFDLHLWSQGCERAWTYAVSLL